MDSYYGLLYKLPKSNQDIFKGDPDMDFSSIVEYPKFSLGFHHFIHQNKDKMNITNEYKNKKKVYLVMNKFEPEIDDYDDNIKNKINGIIKKEVIGRSFYKIWEILSLMNLHNNKSVTTYHLMDNGTTNQAITCFRSNYGFESKNDTHIIVPFTVPYFDKHATNKTQFKRQQKLSRHKRILSRSKTDTYKLYDNNLIKKKGDIIFASSGYNWPNKNIQEQSIHKILLAEIIFALKHQEKGGHFVCRIYETFTETTIKILYTLINSYEQVFIIKPCMSRNYNSEKYLICKNFIGTSDDNIQTLEMIFDTLMSDEYNNKFIVKFFPDFDINDTIKNTFIKINSDISNNQLININEIIDFLNKQNYRGDTYNDRRNLQIKMSNYWVNLFLPNRESFDDKNKQLTNIINNLK